MSTEILKEAMQRAESWPQEAQEELAELAAEIDAWLKGGKYHATPDELAGIDRGLKRPHARGVLPQTKKLKRFSPSIGAHESRLYRQSAARPR